MFKNLARASVSLGATPVAVAGHHSERSLR